MKRSRRLEILFAPCLIFGSAACLLAQPSASDAPLPLLPVTVLIQSPADTKTELQILCLFRSSPENKLHGSLDETNDRLHGLLDRIRQPGLFGGEVGETLLLSAPEGSVGAKRLLIIGLGDSDSFKPERMVLIGKIAMREANRLGIAHPFFAPTVLDGGVSRYKTGEVSEQVVRGFREALGTEAVLRAGGAGDPVAVHDFTFLAGPKFAHDTQDGIDRALGLEPATNTAPK